MLIDQLKLCQNKQELAKKQARLNRQYITNK